MSYSYFGNTSAKEAKLLINIEAHLILLNELFKTATKDDIWKSDSSLQLRYAKILEESKLLDTREMVLISKNARTKVSFLKDLGLVDFDKLKITNLGNQLLNLLNNKKFEEKNEFLQIDLVALFFLKIFFSYKKASDIENMFLKYLYIFKSLGGKLTKEQFYLLPLISNYENIEEFILLLKKENINLVEMFKGYVYDSKREQKRRKEFLKDYNENKEITNLEYFASSKSTNFVQQLPYILNIFIEIRNKSYSKKDIHNIFSKTINEETNYFRNLYLPTMMGTTKLQIKNNNFISMYRYFFKTIRNKTEIEFLNYFFDLIYTSRYYNNLKDYMAQNKYYLDLTGVFIFENNEVKVSEIFNVILKSSKYEEILTSISNIEISTSSLNYLFENEEIKSIFKSYGVSSSSELNNFQYNQNKMKLEKLLETKFTKEKIIEIIPNFKTRNDDFIQKEITNKATVPTIFEYVVAVAWYYIDNKNIDFILKAGLSLDSNMLPKSHAIGGNSDFEIKYDDHTLMIEVTLTESTNQRRAEMESVSRHLGNILLNLDEEKKAKSYGIFIAPYLNKNVLNDFRMRKNCYWENDSTHVKGMNILPFDCDDLVKIISSNKTYTDLKPSFYELMEDSNDWGSKWYNNTVRTFINNLNVL
ncbi:AlwI family type II restriction endonuclease [Aliarcobacter butzleri]|uniref:AlwI family type II restriction endonuclease n=1 Tax=Aliarcobacter butzleri TaxID=28197 RepID=UPI0021B4A11B|nr:AlwI family type II restriction endonuclease [Aliarcobacter butzleri]MCT7557671.1 AlwI family type II restriction endonuclease [Aliarcobacter butzleri]